MSTRADHGKQLPVLHISVAIVVKQAQHALEVLDTQSKCLQAKSSHHGARTRRSSFGARRCNPLYTSSKVRVLYQFKDRIDRQRTRSGLRSHASTKRPACVPIAVLVQVVECSGKVSLATALLRSGEQRSLDTLLGFPPGGGVGRRSPYT